MLKIDSNGSNALENSDSNGRQLNCQSTSDPNDHMNYMEGLFNAKLILKPVVSRGQMLSKDLIDSNGESSVDSVNMLVDTRCDKLISNVKVIVDNNFEGDAKEVDSRGPNVLGLSTDMNN